MMPKHPHLVVDPRIRFGRPTVRGTGLTTRSLYLRWLAGETVEHIADDSDVDELLVHSAIAFELGRSRSKAAREALEP